jgi:catechol 2,3-dioxygenase-like lactoylglutathione lyase family enzyme
VQVIFAVANVERAVAFYEAAFGWPRNRRIDYSNYVEFHVDGGTVGLYERSGFAEEVGAEPAALADGGVSSSYLYVRVDDVAAAAERLEAAGARPLSPLLERSWGERAAWFADPDGHLVAVAETAPVAA